MICKQGPSITEVLVMDHCHKSHFIRVTLCNRCNKHLGLWEFYGTNCRSISFWVLRYKEEIEKYLLKPHTGILMRDQFWYRRPKFNDDDLDWKVFE